MNMIASSKRVFESALSLDDRARVELVGLLLDSIEKHEDGDVEEAWTKEVSRRIADLDSGLVQPVSWDKVKSEVFKVSDN